MTNVYYTIPKGTEPARCPRGCGMTVFWIEQKRAGHAHGVARIPVDTSPIDGAEPDSWSDGRGVNHFVACVGDG